MSDLVLSHFGHRNIIKYSKRPFATPEEIQNDRYGHEHVAAMDETLINNWNSIVQPDDTIYHLGDFGFYRDSDKLRQVFDRLNGSKHLILGNHDKKDTRKLPWASVNKYHEMYFDGEFMVLFHYGIDVFNKMHHGAIHIHGHSHGSLPGHRQRLDVGTDCWDYKPVDLAQIKSRLATLPIREPVDHHR